MAAQSVHPHDSPSALLVLAAIVTEASTEIEENHYRPCGSLHAGWLFGVAYAEAFKGHTRLLVDALTVFKPGPHG